MQPSNNVTIAARGVSKVYNTTPAESHLRGWKRSTSPVIALKEASLIAKRGDSIGVLGRNGSGKSTFLRLIAGSEAPTTGIVKVSSTPTLLGVSAALQPNMSGLTNVRLGLAAMGLDKKSILELQEDVLGWAGLREAAHRPMKTYSSGMQARLKFAIATSVERDILLVDEALSTGDATFTSKAQRRMSEFLENSGTLMIVSHTPGAIEEYCSRAIWIHESEIIMDDTTRRTSKYYKAWARYLSMGNEKAANRIVHQLKHEYEAPKFLFESELNFKS